MFDLLIEVLVETYYTAQEATKGVVNKYKEVTNTEGAYKVIDDTIAVNKQHLKDVEVSLQKANEEFTSLGYATFNPVMSDVREANNAGLVISPRFGEFERALESDKYDSEVVTEQYRALANTRSSLQLQEASLTSDKISLSEQRAFIVTIEESAVVGLSTTAAAITAGSLVALVTAPVTIVTAGTAVVGSLFVYGDVTDSATRDKFHSIYVKSGVSHAYNSTIDSLYSLVPGA